MSPPRTLSLLLAVALAGGLVAACGSSTKPAPPVDPDPPPPCQVAADCPVVACQVASCGAGGACAYADVAADAACDDGQGGKVCDGAGACVECNTAADCQASADVCTIDTECVAHTCNARYYSGAPPGGLTQTPNDCVTLFCDGTAGLVLNFTPGDIVTTTDNPCTEVMCYQAGADPLIAGTTVKVHVDMPCAGGICDPSGVCSAMP